MLVTFVRNGFGLSNGTLVLACVVKNREGVILVLSHAADLAEC